MPAELVERDRNSAAVPGSGRVATFPCPTHNLEERALRKMRFLVVALVAMFSIAAIAFAGTNVYDVSGKSPTGGTKKKPKIVGLLVRLHDR